MRSNSGKPWKAKDDALLEKHYGKLTVREMALLSKRTENSVRFRAHFLGISSSKERSISPLETRRVNRVYERALEKDKKELKNLGLDLSKEKYEKGKVYEIYRFNNGVGRGGRGDYIAFRGKLIQETKHHITLRDKNKVESFLKVDALIKDIEIREAME